MTAILHRGLRNDFFFLWYSTFFHILFLTFSVQFKFNFSPIRVFFCLFFQFLSLYSNYLIAVFFRFSWFLLVIPLCHLLNLLLGGLFGSRLTYSYARTFLVCLYFSFIFIGNNVAKFWFNLLNSNLAFLATLFYFCGTFFSDNYHMTFIRKLSGNNRFCKNCPPFMRRVMELKDLPVLFLNEIDFFSIRLFNIDKHILGEFRAKLKTAFLYDTT